MPLNLVWLVAGQLPHQLYSAFPACCDSRWGNRAMEHLLSPSIHQVPNRPSSSPLSPPALPQDLNKHQILSILLTGQPLAPEERRRQQGLHTLSEEQQERFSQLTRPAAGRGRERVSLRGLPGDGEAESDASHGSIAAAEGQVPPPARGRGAGGSRQHVKQGQQGQDEEVEDRLSPEDFQHLLRHRGLDCRGWKLVVAAHSLGAAVAALVGMHFRSFAPGGRPGCKAGAACHQPRCAALYHMPLQHAVRPLCDALWVGENPGCQPSGP